MFVEIVPEMCVSIKTDSQLKKKKKKKTNLQGIVTDLMLTHEENNSGILFVNVLVELLPEGKVALNVLDKEEEGDDEIGYDSVWFQSKDLKVLEQVEDPLTLDKNDFGHGLMHKNHPPISKNHHHYLQHVLGDGKFENIDTFESKCIIV